MGFSSVGMPTDAAGWLVSRISEGGCLVDGLSTALSHGEALQLHSQSTFPMQPDFTGAWCSYLTARTGRGCARCGSCSQNVIKSLSRRWLFQRFIPYLGELLSGRRKRHTSLFTRITVLRRVFLGVT
ncbi:hypothetical protein [Shewanella cutis]|uniref:Uncharacterized protein n=1 Tax=Shewanella cutis TaxID=2766780 RepID=A0ABS9QPW2_9GAMM|nr:hypothetical protein [Shewanella sp. PS-2]MCG9962382.1 hypothetical protein [Shewanella sp. PS-2]